MESMQLLRALHILLAMSWAGAAYYSLMVVKAANKSDDHARWSFYTNSRHSIYMAAVSTPALLLGGALMGQGDYSMDALEEGFFFFHLAAGFAVFAWLAGAFGHGPTEKKLAVAAKLRLQGEEAPIRHLEARQAKLQLFSTTCISLAVAGMLLFRLF